MNKKVRLACDPQQVGEHVHLVWVLLSKLEVVVGIRLDEIVLLQHELILLFHLSSLSSFSLLSPLSLLLFSSLLIITLQLSHFSSIVDVFLVGKVLRIKGNVVLAPCKERKKR